MQSYFMWALACVLAFISVVNGAGMFSIGYYAFYEKYDVPPTAIEYNKLTHIALGAVYTTSTGTIFPANWIPSMAEWNAFVNQVTPLAHAAGTKTVLMFGGASANVADITTAVSEANCATFAQNLVNHARGLNFDGIDLDWESSIDWAGMKRLAQKIRELWPTVFLTLPVDVTHVDTPGGIHDPTFYQPIMQYLDAVNMMSYSPPDNYGGWDGPWHVSPLSGYASGHPYDIQTAVTTMVARGIPRSKIGLGMAFFGSCWGSPITQPVQNLGNNHMKANDNDISYRNIEKYYRPGMVDHYDNTANVPYLNSAAQVGPMGCTYISYDNDQSILAKANYAIAQSLTGIIIWTVAEGVLESGANPALNSVYLHFGRTYTPIAWPIPTTTTTTTTTATTAATTATTATMLTIASLGSATTGPLTIGRVTTASSATTGFTIGATIGSPRGIPVYKDALASGFVDGSYGARLTNTAPVHAGTYSISFIPQLNNAVFFYTSTRGGIDTRTLAGLTLFVAGGNELRPQHLVFDLILFNRTGYPIKASNPSIVISAPTSGWAAKSISFAQFTPFAYDGFWIRGTTSLRETVVYFDDIQLFPKA